MKKPTIHITDFNYKVYPANISTIKHYELISDSSGTYLFVLGMGAFILFGGWAVYNLIFGGYGWLVCLGIFILILLIFSSQLNKEEKEGKTEEANIQADNISEELNTILSKSMEIVNDILPYLEKSARKSLDLSKIDFAENVFYPFWERIEETCNYLGCYKEAVDQLILNGEIYSKILSEKEHNFPIPFPFGTNVSISNNVLNDLNSIVREAHKNPDFANIFGHFKTHKILVTEFRNLGEALNNMKNEIISSLDSLENSVKTGFMDLKKIQITQLDTFYNSQRTLKETLISMDKKLYYLQYKEKPTTPFLRPHS